MNHQAISNVHHPEKRSQMTEQTLNDIEKLKQIYERVVEAPNRQRARRGLIRCPECSQEILLIPSLKYMSKAIENHIQIHREQLKLEPIKEYQTAMRIRLSMMEQVMLQAYKIQVS